jgi:hypothetical protein
VSISFDLTIESTFAELGTLFNWNAFSCAIKVPIRPASVDPDAVESEGDVNSSFSWRCCTAEKRVKKFAAHFLALAVHDDPGWLWLLVWTRSGVSLRSVTCAALYVRTHYTRPQSMAMYASLTMASRNRSEYILLSSQLRIE